MNESQEKAIRCVANIDKSVESLTLISHEIGVINGMNALVAQASHHQVEVTADVSEHLSSVRLITSRNVTEADSLERESQQLKELAEDFRYASQAFNVSV
jgi:methyl-accepting chemotaxis protein